MNNLSLCMIAGNTADTLETFFRWATDHFTEINVVCQTENVDDTREICEQWGMHEHVRVLYHEFDDFSKQKQRSLDMATRDYIVQLDADEILSWFPYEQIPRILDRAGKSVGAPLLINLQRDHKHFNPRHHPYYQPRVLRRGIKMNGATIDERLDMDPGDVVPIMGLSILHFGHIRPEEALLQKGEDRYRFADDDPADGPQLKTVGKSWFRDRNRGWDQIAVPLESEHVRWIERYI